MLSNIVVSIIHKILYWLIELVYDNCLYTLFCVWEEMGDVLHGLLEDGGWTSKLDFVWHWYSTTMCIKCWLWKCSNWFDIALKCISLSIVKYRSDSMLCWYSTEMCIFRKVWKWFMCYRYNIKMCIPHEIWKCFKDESRSH